MLKACPFGMFQADPHEIPESLPDHMWFQLSLSLTCEQWLLNPWQGGWLVRGWYYPIYIDIYNYTVYIYIQYILGIIIIQERGIPINQPWLNGMIEGFISHCSCGCLKSQWNYATNWKMSGSRAHSTRVLVALMGSPTQKVNRPMGCPMGCQDVHSIGWCHHQAAGIIVCWCLLYIPLDRMISEYIPPKKKVSVEKISAKEYSHMTCIP